MNTHVDESNLTIARLHAVGAAMRPIHVAAERHPSDEAKAYREYHEMLSARYPGYPETPSEFGDTLDHNRMHGICDLFCLNFLAVLIRNNELSEEEIKALCDVDIVFKHGDIYYVRDVMPE